MSDDAAPRTVTEERSLGPMRKTIANRLQESYQEAVHVTVSRAIDVGPLLGAVDAAGPADEDGTEPSLIDGLLCALSETLGEHPAFNATFEDGTHRLYEEHNVGVAVDIEEGLVTPVLADIGTKTLGEIARERTHLVERVKNGDYSMSTFDGGTFTVSNLGPLGVDSFTPVINPPEIAILGVGRVRERAVPGDDSSIRSELTVDLSFDHRVVDGADAARFLGTLDENLSTAMQYVD
jgi:pyruvate dehydrogenase E2 component (dihydrolipoamide acetyltransferase)